MFYLRTKDEAKKQQSKFITVGFAVPIVAYLITNVVFPSFAINIPNLGHIAIAVFGGFVGYAIMKYELFTFDAAMAAENIVSMMPDSLILANMEGKMLKINKRLVSFLGYDETELKNKKIIDLCAAEQPCKGVLDELAEKKLIRNNEIIFKTKLGEEKHVLFSGSVVSKQNRPRHWNLVRYSRYHRTQQDGRKTCQGRKISVNWRVGGANWTRPSKPVNGY